LEENKVLIFEYLSQSAIKFGTRKAIVFQDTIISYRELDEYTNRIARFLIGMNVLSNNVGVFMNKSIDSVSAIFGILKSGLTYIPLDIDSPVERIAYIINECNIEILVTDQLGLLKIADQLDLFRDIRIINLSPKQSRYQRYSIEITGKNEIDRQPSTAVEDPGITENNLAYILYTSGSTGRPKGVMLTHKNASTFVNWCIVKLSPGPDDVFSSHAPFHFDLSILDIFVSINAGATLCLIPKGISYFPEAIIKFIEKNKITIWYSVPTALKQMLASKTDLKKRLSSLKIIIYAGEVFSYQALNRLSPLLTDCRVLNFYGPTETNVITYFELPPHFNLTGNVPIGKACPYAEVCIVDEHIQPARKGQLIVRSDTLMQGYWKDEALTSEKIKSISLNGRSDKFYFTGDLVCLDDEDNLVYINRIDQMIKIRGFRVELGEIEGALMKFPGMIETAALPQYDEETGNHIIAFVVHPDKMLSEERCAKHCASLIPAYMIPEKFIFLERLPKTSTGKLDRQLLKNYPTPGGGA
jgi:amino acid adenylation domain-containing protein